MKQSDCSVFNEMQMFNVKENQYAVLTKLPEKKIIVWNNNVTPYSQLLLQQALLPANQQQHSSSNNLAPLKFFLKFENAWAFITKEANVTTGGDKNYGGDSSSVQSQLKNVKIICSTDFAFTALLGDGRVVAWEGSSKARRKQMLK